MIDWSLLHVEHEREFVPEPTRQERGVAQEAHHGPVESAMEAQFEANEATWENEATMRKDYPSLFHDVISSH